VSLAGRAVVVTRPSAAAGGLAALIERAGGRAILFPAIEIVEVAHPAPARDFDAVVFVSPTAVAMGADWVHAGATTLAVGRGTRAELARRGARDALAPESGADSEALLGLPQLADVRGKLIAIVRGEGGRALLGETLAARGARVEYVECYRRVRPAADASPLLSAWRSGGIDAVTVNSAEALDNLVAMLGAEGARRLRETPLFVPHPRVAERARREGIREVLTAGPSDGEVLERLVAYFSDDREPEPAPGAASGA
jgi:uroporphyrinogen-III synthase